MKRTGILLTSALVVSLFAGCDSGGVREGMPSAEDAKNAQPAGFQALMEKQSKDMKVKRPKNAPSGKAAFGTSAPPGTAK